MNGFVGTKVPSNFIGVSVSKILLFIIPVSNQTIGIFIN